ncbi:hypothetical protein CRG98_005873 [Punica granatum]|uniref:Uncharacterized protein n=1 Tax=Punica granatum TaxID=22663 RepID=A0A2I0KZ42_PUNGR|nr:hypothetical protein CRG98_005873 [Punica granatum]
MTGAGGAGHGCARWRARVALVMGVGVLGDESGWRWGDMQNFPQDEVAGAELAETNFLVKSSGHSLLIALTVAKCC